MQLDNSDLYKELLYYQYLAQITQCDKNFHTHGMLCFDEHKKYLILKTNISYSEQTNDLDSEIKLYPTAMAGYNLYQINEAYESFLRPVEDFNNEEEYLKRLEAQIEFYIRQEEYSEEDAYCIHNLIISRIFYIPVEEMAQSLAQSNFTFDSEQLQKAFIYGGWHRAIENPLIRTGLAAFQLENQLDNKPIIKKQKI